MFFSRNLGLLTSQEQDRLCKGTVLIAGVGGMGGVAAEMLVRMGIGKIKICDLDIFELSNLNRQLHSNIETVGEYKVNVLQKEFLKINPNLKIEVFNQGVKLENIEEMLSGVDIVINGMDQMFESLILERTARLKNITIVDAWLTPYASVFVMTPDSPHWEEFMDLPTLNIPLNQISKELCTKALFKEVEYTFSHFTPYEIIPKEVVDEVLSGKRPRPSLGPVVWLSGVLMANEAMKILTGMKHTDHLGIFFNQYEHQITQGKLGNIKNKIVA